MHGIPRHIIDRQLAHFDKADADYGGRVSEKLNALSPQAPRADVQQTA
jgi:catalase